VRGGPAGVEEQIEKQFKAAQFDRQKGGNFAEDKREQADRQLVHLAEV
jgi:hypothetical protein